MKQVGARLQVNPDIIKKLSSENHVLWSAAHNDGSDNRFDENDVLESASYGVFSGILAAAFQGIKKAFGNRGSGFSSNSNPRMNVTGCRAGNNGGANFTFYFSGRKARVRKTIKNCTELDRADFDSWAWLSERREAETLFPDEAGSAK